MIFLMRCCFFLLRDPRVQAFERRHLFDVHLDFERVEGKESVGQDEFSVLHQSVYEGVEVVFHPLLESALDFLLEFGVVFVCGWLLEDGRRRVLEVFEVRSFWIGGASEVAAFAVPGFSAGVGLQEQVSPDGVLAGPALFLARLSLPQRLVLRRGCEAELAPGLVELEELAG